MKVGIFTDIHFQEKGMSRILSTADWIIEEFKARGVGHVFNLGDSLNTREKVSVEAQSACIGFYHRLADVWPVDVLLGNHDLNLKHESNVSSLDALSMHPRIGLHRDPGMLQVGGRHFLMMPYTENQAQLVGLVQNLCEQQPGIAAETIGLGHLAINGAVQITKANTKFSGAVGPDVFKGLKATFTGHFHVHQAMDHNVIYVGSPQQFNFGDAGDARGVVILDTDTGAWEFVQNPHCNVFRFVSADEIDQLDQDPTIKGSFVTVIYDDFVTPEQHEEVEAKLKKLGAEAVVKESVVDQAIRTAQGVEVDEADTKNLPDLLPTFVEATISEDSALDRSELIEFGKSVLATVDGRHTDVDDAGSVFHADIDSLMIEGFLGVVEPVQIPWGQMADGVWVMEGENGHGKSTLLEAIVWALWGEFLRSDTKVADAVNDHLPRGKGCRVAVIFKNGIAVERWRKYQSGQSWLNAADYVTPNGVRVYEHRDANGHPAWETKEGLEERGEPKEHQNRINNMLGIDYNMASRTCFMGQNIVTNFVTGSEAQRRAIIEEMLGLERFGEYLEQVRAEKKSVVDEITTQEQIQVLRSQELGRIAESITNLQVQITNAEQNAQLRVNELGQMIHNKTEERKTLASQGETVMAQARVALEAAREQAEKTQAQAEDVEATYLAENETEKAQQAVVDAAKTKQHNAQIAFNNHQNTITYLDGRRATLEQEIATLEAQKGSLETISEADVVEYEKIVAQLEVEIRTHEATANAALARKQEASNRSKTRQSQLQDLKALFEGGQEGVCDRCGQPITGGSLEETYRKLLAEEEADLAAAHEAGEQEADARTMITDLTNGISEAGEDYPNRAALERVLLETVSINEQITAKQAELDGQSSQRVGEMQKLAATLGVEETAIAFGMSPYNNELEQALAAMPKRTTNWENVEAVRTTATSARERVVQLESALRVTEQNQQAQTAQIDTDIEVFKSELLALQDGDAAGPLRQTLADQEQSRQEALQVIEEAKNRLLHLTDRKAVVLFWDKAFAAKGGLRAFLLEESVHKLNLVIESYVSAIFPGQSLSFESDLSSKTKYGRKSGGQRKCLDISVLFSTFELVRERTRFRPDFMGCDEIFDALDKKRQKAVQEVVAHLSQRIKKIMVITHADISGMHTAGSLYAEMPSAEVGTKWTIKPT